MWKIEKNDDFWSKIDDSNIVYKESKEVEINESNNEYKYYKWVKIKKYASILWDFFIEQDNKLYYPSSFDKLDEKTKKYKLHHELKEIGGINMNQLKILEKTNTFMPFMAYDWKYLYYQKFWIEKIEYSFDWASLQAKQEWFDTFLIDKNGKYELDDFHWTITEIEE